MIHLITLLFEAEPHMGDLSNEIYDALSKIITIENIKFLDIDQLNATFSIIFDYRRRTYRFDSQELEFLSTFQDIVFNQFILLYSSLIADLNSENTNKTLTLNLISRLSLNVEHKDHIYHLAIETLAQIKVRNAMLLMYPKEMSYTRVKNDFNAPDMYFLKGHVKDGEVVQTNNAFFNVDQLLDAFPGDYKTVSTISFNEHQYGLLITDASPDQLSDVEFLVSQIGNALYITGILENLNLQSITDELTGVFNRRGILEKLQETLASLRHDEFAYILFADLDHLKKINDKFGHDAGDQAIKAEADVLTQAFPRDLVGRIGGDEFMVILKTRYPSFITTVPNCIKEAENKMIAERHFKFPFRLSYGMSVFEHNYSEEEIQRVIDNADSFMYQLKQEHHRSFNFEDDCKNL
jgi:diguanylate cyclase (GGDEF)-like protein